MWECSWGSCSYAVVNSVMFKNKAGKGRMLAVGVGTVWRSVGKGSFQMNSFLELVGLSTDTLGDPALVLVLPTTCFAHIKRYCFRGDGPKEVKFLSGLEQPLGLPYFSDVLQCYIVEKFEYCSVFCNLCSVCRKAKTPCPPARLLLRKNKRPALPNRPCPA